MSKIYELETDPALVEFCLNCKNKKCVGNCDALKQEKKRLLNKKKESKRGENESN